MSNSVTSLLQHTDIRTPRERKRKVERRSLSLEGYTLFHRRLATCMVITHDETLQESTQLVLNAVKKIDQQCMVEIHPSGLLFHNLRDSPPFPFFLSSPYLSITCIALYAVVRKQATC